MQFPSQTWAITRLRGLRTALDHGLAARRVATLRVLISVGPCFAVLMHLEDHGDGIPGVQGIMETASAVRRNSPSHCQMAARSK
jgi:hypothetical protein